MQKSGIWDRRLKGYLEAICKNCDICLQMGGPLPARQVSLAQIDCTFNSEVGVDFFYWPGSQSSTVLYLYVMCKGTSLSEVQLVESRVMSTNAAAVYSLLIHQHGRPVALSLDPEFNKAELLAVLTRNGIWVNHDQSDVATS